MTAEIAIYHQGTLPEPLAWQSLSFMRCEWPWLFSGDGRLRDQPFPAAVHLACTEGPVLLSYAEIVASAATKGNERVPVAGLSNVFTFPPYRHEGLAARIVRAANSVLDEGHPEIAVLFCKDELISFYAALGWTAAPAATITSAGGTPTAMVRRAGMDGAGLVAELRRAPLAVAELW